MNTYSPAHAAAAFELETPSMKAYVARDWKKYAELKNKQADLFEQAGLPGGAETSRSAAKEVASLIK